MRRYDKLNSLSVLCSMVHDDCDRDVINIVD